MAFQHAITGLLISIPPDKQNVQTSIGCRCNSTPYLDSSAMPTKKLNILHNLLFTKHQIIENAIIHISPNTPRDATPYHSPLILF